MASATFQLRAADETAQAFASVQNRLQKMHATAKQVGVGMATFFGFGAAVGGVKRLDAFLQDAEVNAKKLGLTSEDLDKLTIATGFADEQAMRLQTTAALAAATLAGAFSSGDTAAQAFEIRAKRVNIELNLAVEESKILEQQLKDVGLGESVNAEIAQKRADQIRKNAEQIKTTDPLKYQQEINKALGLEIQSQQTLFSLKQNYDKATEAFGAAQSKLLDGDVKTSEKIIGLRAKESSLLIEMTTFSLNDYENQTRIKTSLTEIYGKLLPLMQEEKKLAMDAGQAIAQSFEDAAISGGNLREIIKGLTQDLLRLVFRQQITQPLAGVIGEALFKGFRAEGGPVGAGGSYVVGEKGPELFVPGSSGSIIPNGAMGVGGSKGGSSVNVTYNIASGVSRADLAPILEQERKRLKAEIPDMVRRGGSYRAAFA
jgi:hypothetical protein